ncbi:SUR7/PalI family-domain-containing protein [Leptodontidium sp. 2 PMI_412]|nr:SUR7/PalI family-domain-containing protein [Leptodontidium sp. 2 PMI_412]
MAGGGLRGALGIVSLVLIGGALVMMFFVVLSGVKDTTPLNKTWFLRADTSSFPGAGRAESYWTFWRICATGGGQCGSTVPALPFGYAWVGGSEGVPNGLTGPRGKGTTSNYYYYLWRFGWVFYLMSLVLTSFTFLTSALAPCSRLAAGFSGAFLAFSLFWFSLAASLMTVVFVKARDEFHDAGISASIGRYAFGFTWGAWAAMFLATVFLFMGCGVSRKGDDHVRSTKTKRSGGGVLGSIPFFRRQRSKRSNRGSFVDAESQHRVKEEY